MALALFFFFFKEQFNILFLYSLLRKRKHTLQRSGLWRRKISYKFLDFLSESSCFCIIFQRILRGHEEAGAIPQYFCSTETYWPSSRVKCWLAFCRALLGSCLHRFYKPQVKGSKLQSDNLERDSQLQLPFVRATTTPWLDYIQHSSFWKRYSFRGPQQISFVFSIFLDVSQGAGSK